MLGKVVEHKTVLIFGGTGSIGSKILDSVRPYRPKKIIIFSRNEHKQYQLRYKYSKAKNVQFVLGDIRDLSSVMTAARNVDIIFHCAALKHVPFSEEMPEEFIRTNILGSLNVFKAALHHGVSRTISISTDKVVDPANLMGLSKAVQEKIFSSHHLNVGTRTKTNFINVRFGNVIGTHGSFFPLVHHQLQQKKPVTLTHPEMTRFFISSQEAIELILWATTFGKNGDIVIRKMKSVYIRDVIQAFKQVLNAESVKTQTIGIRAGEKLHESLITEDNLYRTREIDGYYIVAPYSAGNSIVLQSRNKTNKIEQFYSDYAKNVMSKGDLMKYVKLYLDEAKNKNVII